MMPEHAEILTEGPGKLDLQLWWNIFEVHYQDCGECSICRQFRKFIEERRIIDKRLKTG